MGWLPDRLPTRDRMAPAMWAVLERYGLDFPTMRAEPAGSTSAGCASTASGS